MCWVFSTSYELVHQYEKNFPKYFTPLSRPDLPHVEAGAAQSGFISELLPRSFTSVAVHNNIGGSLWQKLFEMAFYEAFYSVFPEVLCVGVLAHHIGLFTNMKRICPSIYLLFRDLTYHTVKLVRLSPRLLRELLPWSFTSRHVQLDVSSQCVGLSSSG